MEQLEAAGARFRVLGLSATPGTNIKSIQQVVDALRINKIEARHDTDPSVAKYIHERQSEIVIVKQASACKNIERLLNDLIGPLLDRLRSGGALTRITGNATVTSYSIIKAREDFVKRTNDESMSGYFFAAQQLIQLRSSLHQHGANVVRGKLSRWRNEVSLSKRHGKLVHESQSWLTVLSYSFFQSRNAESWHRSSKGKSFSFCGKRSRSRLATLIPARPPFKISS